MRVKVPKDVENSLLAKLAQVPPGATPPPDIAAEITEGLRNHYLGRPGPAIAPEPAQAAPGKPKPPPLLEAKFAPPATWTVPVYTMAGDNIGSKLTKARRIGRSGHDRRQVYHTLARQLRVLADFQEHLDNSGTVAVRCVRLGPAKLDGHDDLPIALKYVIDAVADLLGVDDRDSRWVWLYGQSYSKEHGVSITLEKR